MQMIVCNRCGKVLPGPPVPIQEPGVGTEDDRQECEKNGFCSRECEMAPTAASRLVGMPKNLVELMKGSQEGYLLCLGYSLELEHGLMGYFPALVDGTDRVVITTDKELLLEIWRMLTPRRSKMDTELLLVNTALGIGYPILGNSDYDRERSEPLEVLSRVEFEKLRASKERPFRWAPGLVGDDMNREEFRQTLEAALKENARD